MVSTFLKRNYFDDRKLQQRTFLELLRALDSGRLIAVVGSMATQAFGYPGWEEFRRHYLETSEVLLKKLTKDEKFFRREGISRNEVEQIAGIVRGLRKEYELGTSKIDSRVALSAAKEALKAIDDRRRSPSADHSTSLVSMLDEETAARFKKPKGKYVESADVPGSLIRDLGVSRFITLNYDFELERATMSRPILRTAAVPSKGYAEIKTLMEMGTVVRDARVPYRLVCTLPNGLAVDSDVFNRERPDRLIEFALGSAATDRHVFHLHGRACTPSTMVVGVRDYDQLYRQTHPSRLPFKEGLRLLFSGNPILFVGLGMSEAEVNQTLQTFVSDNPYRYQAPIFLLWNTFKNSRDDVEHQRQKRVARLDWLMRLGVFVIFDDEVKGLEKSANYLRISEKQSSNPKKFDRDALELLAKTLEKLGRDVTAIRERVRYVGKRFRDTRTKMERSIWHESLEGAALRVDEDTARIRLWSALRENTARDDVALDACWKMDAYDRKETWKPRVIVGRPGIGKGSLSRRVFEKAFDRGIQHRLLVNANFCYDADSLADALVRFLQKLHKVGNGALRRAQPTLSREQLLSTRGVFNCASALVVINGIDRFFTTEGYPLSAELDQLLRRIAQTRKGKDEGSENGSGALRFVFFGTDRIRRYFERFEGFQIIPLRSEDESFHHLDRLRAGLGTTGKANEARIEAARRSSTGSHAYRKAVVGALLEPSSFAERGSDPRLALDIVRTLAFIGMPVEAVVLLHAPSVRSRLISKAGEPGNEGRLVEDEAARILADALQQLKEQGVIIEFDRFDDYPDGSDPIRNPLWRRYGLHRTIIAELRERHGVPLSSSKRATAFNLSLYVARPVDSDTPEVSTHDELALLIDRLIGSYKDKPATSELPRTTLDDCKDVLEEQRQASRPALGEDDEVLVRLLAPASVATLRSALAVVRGYYSTTTLLTIDRGQRLAGPERDGALLEHAERLERLLRGYRKLSRFRDAWVSKRWSHASDRTTDERGEWLERQERLGVIGPEPFYPDEIVWLFNELGTVRLAQGDLYAARNAFDRAFEVNREVEHTHHSHNWRRIMLNAVMVDIERGRLAAAEDHLRQIERTVDDRVVPFDPADVRSSGTVKPNPISRSGRVIRDFAKTDERHGESPIIHPEFLHEEILVVGLVSSMRGLLEHLRGHMRTAKAHYQDGIQILRRLGEHRAYALFQRYYAQLLRSLGDIEGHQIEIGLAVAAAESVRQMDFAYPARMIQAETDFALKRGGEYIRQALDAQEYSMLTDIHRVRVDAATRLARAKLSSGDYEMALDHATDALATAARFGMSLRKINLRILMGQIMIRRGDRKSGTALIDNAIEQADRIGYQRAVALAQRVRAMEAVSF